MSNELEDMFDPEELAMMAEADADMATGGVPAPSIDDMYDQVAHLSGLIFQGGEREAELRQMSERLMLLNEATSGDTNVHDQVQSLAEMVRQGAEREAQLRGAIKKLTVLLSRRSSEKSSQ